LLRHVEDCVRRRNNAVILVAEGAGQDLMPKTEDRDDSGNPKLADVGLLLQARLSEHFKSRNLPLSLKYIDPSYIIRGAPANPEDSLYSARLATNAVHAAMAGKTRMLVSLVNNRFVHVPMQMAISRRNSVDPEGSMWRDVIDTTGQPPLMKN
jgi:6-phosphofructokinase 1